MYHKCFLYPSILFEEFCQIVSLVFLNGQVR